MEKSNHVPWLKATNSYGREYYYNPETHETSWEWKEWMKGSAPPPPPPPSTELQEMEDFARSCGWNGLCILKDYYILNGGKHDEWENPDNHTIKGRFYRFKEGSPICCKAAFWHQSDFRGRFSIKGKNPDANPKDFFPQDFYPCPSCFPEYWHRAMLRNSITEEEWLESSEVLGTNLDITKVGCTVYPSPKKMTLTPSCNIECTILYRLVKEQMERMDDMEEIIEAGKEKITQLEQRITDLQLGVDREAVDTYQLKKKELTNPE